jgi:exodeoxyribonuclease V alpha subunit
LILKLLDGEANSYLLKQQIENNPYELTRIHGVGFQPIDKFAIKLKPELLKSKHRVMSCIQYVLKEIGNSEGHSWIEIERLTQLVKSLVPECRDIYKEVIQACRQECSENLCSFLYADEKRVGLYGNYHTEKMIAAKLWALQSADNLYTDVDYDIALTALSAKAARRMTEVTGADALTIHRLLEFYAKGFKRNSENPLYQKLIIIDEASMINSSLFLSLLDAVSLNSKVVIVFDFAQLSPIGIGNVATDLLTSTLPIYRFTKIHRQAEKSGILVDANKIRIGESPIDEFEESTINGELQDMVYYFREQPTNSATYEQLNDLALKTFAGLLEQGVNIDDISVIVPRRQSVMNSVNYFNKKMQDIVITEKVPYMEMGDKTFKLGAKVIQRVNDYKKDVVNGEVGYITDILKPHKDNKHDFLINFGDNKVVKYKRNELEQIDLAYAITVHLSQGSQYKYVIVVLDMSHFMLLDMCLFYTAVTRAGEMCYCIAQPKAFIHALSNNKAERQTFLQELIYKQTTGKALMDLNLQAASLRTADETEIMDLFMKAFYEDRLLAVKWLFYIRDAREGAGERRLFRVIVEYLCNHHPEALKNVIQFIPEYGRYDDMWCILGTQLNDIVIDIIKTQLKEDEKNLQLNKPISRISKWLPSCNTSSKETVWLAKRIIKMLGVSEKQYRKTLSKMRNYLGVVEVKMSAKQWDDIDYQTVPSRANLVYNRAFLRNDGERRQKHPGAFERGKSKINSSVPNGALDDCERLLERLLSERYSKITL